MDNAPALALASQSPRRRMMLAWLGIPFAVTNGEVDEAPVEGESPSALAARLAAEKAVRAAAAVASSQVLTADTVVDLDGQTLGKPADAAEARAMLEQLRDHPHQVHTAVALAWSATHADQTPEGVPTPPLLSGIRVVSTNVVMRRYTDAEIAAYIATSDPFDKAGAYAIQHPGFHPVAGCHVCYANVVGLPLCAVVRLLKEAEARISESENRRIGEGMPNAWHIEDDVPALCLRHFGYTCPAPDEGIGITE